MNKSPTSYDGSVDLGYVAGEGQYGGIAYGQTVTFYFSLTNNSSLAVFGLTNGFRVYSPDGVSWDTTVAARTTAIDWSAAFGSFNFIQYNSPTGSGCDTVGFSSLNLGGTGLQPGTYDTALTISVGPINQNYQGKHVCVDSCYFPPQGMWLWAASDNHGFYPAWDGPHCFEIEPPMPIHAYGYVGYVDPVPPTNDTVDMSDVYIEMYDHDTSPVQNQLLANTWAQPNGEFEFFEVSNTDVDGANGQDIFYRVVAMNSHAMVYTGIGSDRHSWDSDTIADVAGGQRHDTVVVPAASAGPFFLANNVLKDYDTWNSLTPGTVLGDVAILLNTTCTTGYHYGPDMIYVNDSTNPTLSMWSPKFSEWMLHHEYGHRIIRNTGFFDESPGGTHWLGGTYSDSLAASEGLSHFWAGYVQDSSMLVNYWNNFNDHDWLDLENGVFSDSGVLFGSANAMGLGNEGAVAGILWDIYDDEDDDYSGPQDLGSLSLPHHPDYVGDTLSAGIEPIVNALFRPYIDAGTGNDHRPDDMDEFWYCWFHPIDKCNDVAIGDIYYEHGDSTKLTCCSGITGNINGDAEESIDISDLVYLVNYMFNHAPEPPCLDEGDMNGSGAGPDITDLVYMVTYLFSSGPGPASCQ